MENNWNNYFFKFIKYHSDKPWSWSGLSQNPNITMDIVKANPRELWDWCYLTRIQKMLDNGYTIDELDDLL